MLIVSCQDIGDSGGSDANYNGGVTTWSWAIRDTTTNVNYILLKTDAIWVNLDGNPQSAGRSTNQIVRPQTLGGGNNKLDANHKARNDGGFLYERPTS